MTEQMKKKREQARIIKSVAGQVRSAAYSAESAFTSTLYEMIVEIARDEKLVDYGYVLSQLKDLKRACEYAIEEIEHIEEN